MLCGLNPRVLFSPSLVSLPRYVVRYGLTCEVHSIPRVPCWSLDGGAFWLCASQSPLCSLTCSSRRSNRASAPSW